MTKAELLTYVGKKVLIVFKGDFDSAYGVLKYADEFSEKHDYRKLNHFYIGNKTFLSSHVARIKESEV